ncbi:quinoprotein glucose dehydrogenase, partial [Janthinobacterium sp. YR213]
MIPSFRPGPLLKVTGVIFILFGLALLGGGIWLATLGGSWYYLLAGIGMLVAGVLVFKGKRSAQPFMALLLTATLIWSVIEVKFDWWQLLPRLDIWFAAAVWLLLPFIDRRLDPP